MNRLDARLNLEEQKFGYLTAIRDVGCSGGHRVWECKCVCGKLHNVPTSHLRNGHTRSCGCKSYELYSGTLHPRWGGGKNNKGSLSWSRNIIMKANKNASNKEYTPPNITAEELAEIYSNHNKCCDICGTPESELKLGLCIDHCHKTGNIRGFLCNPCNIAIGFLGDSQELLEKAKEYLNRDNAGTLTKSSG